MSITAEAGRKNGIPVARRLIEALLFGLATAGVLLAPRLILEWLPENPDESLWRVAAAVSTALATGCMACVGFVAGLRRSGAGLLAVLAVLLVYAAYAWGVRFP